MEGMKGLLVFSLNARHAERGSALGRFRWWMKAFFSDFSLEGPIDQWELSPPVTDFCNTGGPQISKVN